MKTSSYKSMRNTVTALSHKNKYGKITDQYRIPRKLKKAMNKHFL